MGGDKVETQTQVSMRLELGPFTWITPKIKSGKAVYPGYLMDG